MIMPKVSLVLRIGNKTIALTPVGIKALPYLTTKEMLVAIAYFTAMRYSYLWWVGDLFAKSKQYYRLPISLIELLYNKLNISKFAFGNSIEACKRIPNDKRRPELGPIKQGIIYSLADKEMAKALTEEAITNRYSKDQLNERISILQPKADV